MQRRIWRAAWRDIAVRFLAGDLAENVAPIVKSGGGPRTMAQAGGKDLSRIGEALDDGRKWIEDRLG